MILVFRNIKKRYLKHLLIKNLFLFTFLLAIITNTVYAQRLDKEKVILQLKWKNQFQFAGYYAAIEKGFYKDVGLDVEVREIEKVSNVTEIVLNGIAQYGIGNSELVIQYMNGLPVVVLACILQNSPSALVVKSSSNIYTPKDLVNKLLEINVEESGVEIIAMLKKAGITPDKYKTTQSTFSLNNLLSNKVDALEIYSTNEPFFLTKFGIPYRMINPRDYGINFYSDCLFTSREEIKKHPDRVRKFRQASLKGWDYALSHPEEIANIIQYKYKSIKTLDHLLFEAEEMRKLAVPEFVQIGHSNKERWLSIVETLSQQGLITNLKDIDGFIYNPEENYNLTRTTILAILVITISVVMLFLAYIYYKTRASLLKRTSEFKSLSIRYEALLKEINRLKTGNGKSNS